MTNAHLTSVLAKTVMGWSVSPSRFMMDARRWLPRWRFQPLSRIEDAFRLLQQASPMEYSIAASQSGDYTVKVRIGDTTGVAREASQPLAITLAIARAVGIEV